MTAFISEFRSMTFQCKSEISSSIQFSEINSYVERDHHIMAPQQLDTLPKSSERIIDSEKARENQVSPISSLGGTSMESSSPAMLNEATPENINGNYEMDHSQKHDPSSDDSGSMPNELPGYQGELRSPLEQLQCSLGKDGMLGQKLNLSEYPGQKDDIRNSSNASLSSAEQSCIYYDSSELYKCHLCTYASNSKHEFNIHMNSHFDHKCPYCDYTSRTEGRLKRHVKDFHSETPPESWAGTRVPREEANGSEQSMDDNVTSSNGKMRSYRCKQCDFVAYQKNDFWDHHKTHIKVEKLLSCPQCAFVTEYKHHLEYHIRNHFGSKPFKCSKCNYSCVNKSMLNSHMKSHSNIYQYRCANCTYATKYCHSLKLHLRKYDHKPATVLNLDGTPNPYPVIDVYGTRRGPRTKKRRIMEDSNNSVSSTAAVSGQPPMNYQPAVPLLPTNVPVTYPQFINGYPGYPVAMPHVRVKHDNTFKCIMCDFVTDNEEIHHKHMILHAASENPDLIKLYGINSDSLIHFQDQMAFNNYVQSQRHYMEHLQRNGFDPHDIQKERSTIEYGMEEKNIKDEEESNISYQRDVKNSSPRNDSRKEFTSSSYVYDSESLIHKERQERDNNEEQERSVIVAHKSSPIPTAEQQMEIGISNSQNKNVEHSPLDLSGSKQFDPSSNADETKRRDINEGKRTPDLKNASPNSDPSSMSSACQRNRRKGKAFKIDHYIQYDDHPLNSELMCKERNEKNNVVHHNSGMKHSNEEIASYSKQDSQQSSPISNNKSDKSLSPKQPQNMPFQISNSVKPLNRNEYSSPSRTSPIHSPSPHEFLGAFNKSSSSTAPKANGWMPKERNEVTKLNTFNEPAVHPKLEFSIGQSSTIPIRPKTFECEYCAMAFRDCTMYTVHMGFHGFGNPFTCNMCGQQNKDRVEFFIHIARAAHE